VANSNISKDSFFNIGGNPNLDAADTGVDPSTGRILTKKERKEIFKKRKISASGVFGRKSSSEALVKRKEIVPIVTGLLTGGVAEKLMKDKGDDELESDSESNILKGLIVRVNNNSKKLIELKNIVKLNIEKVSKLFYENVQSVSKQQAEDLKDQRLEEEEEQRKKKEGFLEKVGKSFKSTLLSPVEKVGKGAKGILERLGDAFMALFMGFVANKGIKMFQALMEGDTETFKKMRNMLIGSVAVVGGIFLALNVGLAALPAIIGGLATAVVSIGAAMLAFLASPAGLIALGLAAGIGVLFAIKQKTKDKDAANKANKDKLREAGVVKIVGDRGADVIRDGKKVFVETKDLTEKEKAAIDAFKVEETRIKDITKKKDEDLKGVEDRITNERESMDNPEWAKIMAVKDLKKRRKLIKEFRKQTKQIVDKEKKLIKENANESYNSSSTESNITSSSETNITKNNNNIKKEFTELAEPKVEIIDVSANKKKKRNQNQKAVATIVPNISAFDPDNSSIFYTEMQFNIG
tara:strand:+ start:1673 stop:3241 length:1569 start_codon:yes stop_codon:yes gene_type:complete